MPLVRIELPDSESAQDRERIGEVVHQAMASCLNVPVDDRFQIITGHPAGRLVHDRGYLGIQRSERVLMIQITLNKGRSLEQKKAFYAAVADGLNAQVGWRREDVLINLVEVAKEDWSFGNGEAQYA